ncbi:hypothetical protein VNO78_25213 [Psophocarpus tetragonolobus]|uniref:Uncharacterized protein n=1 Tax=Psophocarpus tetragonolobus TaxID=3891 RepID=A0AAN9S6I5_PSOTE
MKVDVEIISREDVRPSSPTPTHLRVFKLSLLDHLIPSPYAPIILYYNSPKDDTTYLSEVPNRLELLKKSLSKTLTQFYPLGGKIKEDLSIECNDEGANFVQAKVKCPLGEFLVQPQLTLLHKFLPSDLVSAGSNSGTYVTNIQVNIFECGGIVIGVCISHRIVDGAALSTFIKGWTERAKGCNQLTQPNFIASSLFPTNSPWLRGLSMWMWGSLFKQGNWVTRRFLFRNSDIASLKAQTLGTANSTRLEIVSSMLWKSLMGVSKARFGTQRPSLVTHLMNLRRRMDETLCPQHAMGNLLWLVAAENMSDHEMELEELVGKLRSAISKVDDKFVEELRGDKGRSIMQESLRAIGEMGSKSEVDYCGFSSWCNFGFYEADFGWGKPTWVSGVGSIDSVSVFMNLIILVDTRLGDGIEAWVTLDVKDMNHLEANPELLSCATLDPSPISMSSVA